LLLLISGAFTHAAAAQLAISSLVQYSRVIQGGQDPVYAVVYNQAPAGSGAAAYQAYATFPYGNSNSYVGSRAADGGAGYDTLPFNFDSSRVAPGTNIPISVTGTDTATGFSLTQSGSVTVLAHAAPALILQGQIVYLSSKNTVTFQTPTNNNFAESTPGGTPATASANPQMMGDPPGVPTDELDLDSITFSGSSAITTSLQPFTDLPANDDPAQAFGFQLNVNVPAWGDYLTTFTLHYSDEQDLPGAFAPGSELASFTVEADIESDVTTWTVTTVPEPGALELVAVAAACALACRLWRAILARNVRHVS
jgi:hypothetical protein